MNIPRRTSMEQSGPCWEMPLAPRAGWEHPVPGVKALFTCPCGHISGILVHTIAQDGGVSPAYRCPAAACTFHDWLVLEGWSAPIAHRPSPIAS